MPYDLEAVERGFGECVAEYNGNEILLRYRVDLDGRAMHAMRRAVTGSPIIGQPQMKMPDTDLAMSELVRVLLPSGPDVAEDQRGWDLVRAGVPIPVTTEEMERLPFDLPILLLGRIMRDIQDPNRRRPSLKLSGTEANSAISQTTTDSSKTPPTPPSTPSSSPTPIDSIRPAGSSSEQSEDLPDDGSAGDIGYEQYA